MAGLGLHTEVWLVNPIPRPGAPSVPRLTGEVSRSIREGERFWRGWDCILKSGLSTPCPGLAIPHPPAWRPLGPPPHGGSIPKHQGRGALLAGLGLHSDYWNYSCQKALAKRTEEILNEAIRLVTGAAMEAVHAGESLQSEVRLARMFYGGCVFVLGLGFSNGRGFFSPQGRDVGVGRGDFFRNYVLDCAISYYDA